MKSAKSNNNSKYGYRCAHCEGTVRQKKVAREAFKHKKGFIILEDVIIGVCNKCGTRYYGTDILHAVHEIAKRHKTIRESRENSGRSLLDAVGTVCG